MKLLGIEKSKIKLKLKKKFFLTEFDASLTLKVKIVIRTRNFRIFVMNRPRGNERLEFILVQNRF